MYNNSQKNNDSINKSALTLSFFVHIILLLFLFWNIQWKNKSESLQTIEVELYNEIPGNAATTKKTKQVNNIQKKEVAKVIEPEKKLQNLVEKTPKVIDDRKADIELQKQIALTQAGLYAQAVNVAKLNSSAAANLYSANTVQRNVELTQSTIANNELAPVKKLEQNSNTIELLNVADKNSNSSNGFNPFKSSDEKSAKGEKEAELNNLFA